MKLYLVVVQLLFFLLPVYSVDTIFIKPSDKEVDIINYIYTLEDEHNDFEISEVLNKKTDFKRNDKESINFGYTLSAFWLHFKIEDISNELVPYILNISNHDLNTINYYHFANGKLIKEISTGELKELDSRDIRHRKFLFKLELLPNVVNEIYIKVYNRGDSSYVPIQLQQLGYFNNEDNRETIIIWFLYGFLVFMIIFNLFLFKTTKESINLYYSLFIIFITFFLLITDGYLSYLDIFWFKSRLKILSPAAWIFFLLLFSETFLDAKRKYPILNYVFNVLKILTLISAILYFLNKPILAAIAVAGIGIYTLITIGVIIFGSIRIFNKSDASSIYFLAAFICMLIGSGIFQIKEFGILPSTLIIENGIRIGITLQNILLTIAVLERFRTQQEDAKKTIEKSHKRIELQNRELEIINAELEKLSIVASETDNSVAIYDMNGKIEWCNEGFERFYETDISRLIKQNTEYIEEIIPFSNVKELFQKCLQNKEAVIFEAKLKFDGKMDKWVRTTLSPYVKGNKVIAVDTDITSLKDYETNLKLAKEKAEESDKVKTIFLSNMSHEVRTPLNGILGFSELLNSEEISSEERARFVEIIKSNGEQLIRIIDDILDMSLIETNQLKIWNSDFSLIQLCNELVEFFEFYKSTINKSDIKLITEFNINIEYDLINSDNSRLKQVLMNLLKNGFKFTDEGYVKLSCSTNEDNILFFVEDTGIGIDSSKIDDIFKRFRQADERTTRKYGGNGLGLTISKGIIEKMGGDIWIDPEYSLGFRICFVIPLRLAKKNEPNMETDGVDEQQRLKIKNKRILIVEDHEISYQYLEDLLKPFSIAIFRAVNGVEAVQEIKENHFDLVLMDINLPELDGIEATKQIRRFNIDIPIIAQTAYAMSTDESEILESGCNDVISKPINSKKLFEKIEMYL